MMNIEQSYVHHNAPAGAQAAALGVAIGTRVRQVRNALNLTLDQLAERSGVSRRMLINIEKGEANPSMTVLLRVGDALGIGLPALVEPPRTVPFRVTEAAAGATLWTGENGGSGVLVAGTRAPNVVELWLWTLEPGESHTSAGHNPGTIELLHLHQGAIALSIDDQDVVLAKGDALEFDGDRSHTYKNNGDTSAVFSMVVYEPVSSAGQSLAKVLQ